MVSRIVSSVIGLSLLGVAAAFAAPATTLPDPANGLSLGERLCSNCHLVGTGQKLANVDIPSFVEIANQEGQTEGSIMAKMVLPKHPMPTIPLTKSELADLAAYIMTLRDADTAKDP